MKKKSLKNNKKRSSKGMFGSVAIVVLFSVALVYGIKEYANPEMYRGYFNDRNCNNFVMHVSSLMNQERTSDPLSRSGNRKELYKRCRDKTYSYTKIDCTLRSKSLESVHRCLYL